MTDLLVPLLRRTLVGLINEAPTEEGLSTYLRRGSYVIENFDAVGQSFSIANFNRSEFLSYTLYDYQRFALASVETYVASRLKYFSPRATGWPLVQRYYAAFFAAHAVMRATGKAVTRLETEEVNQLTQLAQAYGIAQFQLPRGTYQFDLTENEGAPAVVFARYVGAGVGSHEIFWRRFIAFLSDVSDGVLRNNEPDAHAIVGRLNELQRILCANGANGGNWLSLIRNRINYQHLYGVWFPFRGADAELSRVRNRFASNSAVRLDHLVAREPLLAFNAATQFLSCLNFELGQHMAATVPASAIFSRDWRRLVRDAAA